MSQSFADILAIKKAELNEYENQINQLYANANLPIVPKDDIQQSCHLERYMRIRPRDGKSMGWANREICTPYNAAKPQQDEARKKIQKFEEKNIHPLEAKIKKIKIELPALEEKAKLPLLREQLKAATAEYGSLSPNDPEFRQKQIDQKKSLYEKAVALDTLERKHNLFGNLPPVRPEREIIEVTPDPITVYKEPEIIQKSLTIGTADFNYKKLAIAGAGIFAVLALILWRFK